MPERMMCSGWASSNPFKNTDASVTEVCMCVWQRCCKRRHITQRVTTVSRLETVKQPQESVHEGARDRDRSLAGLQRAVRGEEGRSEVRRDGLQGVFRCTVDVHVLERRTHQCQTKLRSKYSYLYNKLCSRDHKYVVWCRVSVFALVITSSFCRCTVVFIRHIGCYGFQRLFDHLGKVQTVLMTHLQLIGPLSNYARCFVKCEITRTL